MEDYIYPYNVHILQIDELFVFQIEPPGMKHIGSRSRHGGSLTRKDR